MWFRKFFQASQPRRKAGLANPSHAGRRPRFEAFEDRRMLSLIPAVNHPVGTDPQAVVTADFNGDGRLDLATANTGSNNVSVLLGDGAGGFGAAQPFAAGAYCHALAVADFNGDTKLDLVVAGVFDVFILRGNGDGTFQSPVYIPSQLCGPQEVAVGDLNSDGNVDLVVTDIDCITYYSEIYVMLGNGQGGFVHEPAKFVSSSFAVLNGLGLTDLNGDGNVDVVTADVNVLLGNGDGTLQDESFFHYSGGWPRPALSVAIGDFAGEGNADLVVASDGVQVLRGLGNGRFDEPITHSANGAAHTAVATADFNADGKLDAVTSDGDTGTVSLLLGNGDGTLTYAGAFGTGASPTAVAIGDFNGDGRPDVVAANGGSNTVSVLLNDGAWSDLPGDVNGDGAVDIFDINVVSANWGGPGPIGDANLDGLVNIFDINLISAHWTGTPNSSVSTELSPPAAQTREPTSVAAEDATKHPAKPRRETSLPERAVGVDRVFASWHSFDQRSKGGPRAELAPTVLDDLLAAHRLPSRSEIRTGRLLTRL
jgi:FG-GAP-like repeat